MFEKFYLIFQNPWGQHLLRAASKCVENKNQLLSMAFAMSISETFVQQSFTNHIQVEGIEYCAWIVLRDWNNSLLLDEEQRRDVLREGFLAIGRPDIITHLGI